MASFFGWGKGDQAHDDHQMDAEEKLIRLAAELDNVRRRARREGEEAAQRERAAILGELIGVIDNFDRALSAPGAEGNAWLDGMRGVRAQLIGVLQQFGAASFDPVGEPFDPNRHDAVSLIDEGGNSEIVGEVLQTGYQWNDEAILRPARVVVVRR